MKLDKGLTQLRASFPTKGEKPKYHCSNCNCNRYSPCNCMKKKGTEKVDSNSIK